MFPIFLAMLNDCLRLGLEEGALAYEDVKRTCYPRMLQYQVHDAYRISAVFQATNMLKKFRTDSRKAKVREPMCRNPFLAVSLGVWLEGSRLRLPDCGGVELNPHTLAILSEPGISITSLTLTPSTCSVVYRKSVEMIAPAGMVAVDINEANATTFDTSGHSAVYDLSTISTIHQTYRRVKSRLRRNDVRVKGDLYRKYASIEHHRSSAILHRVSSQIVKRAVAERQTIILENLKGLREMYSKGSGSSSYYLSKMNAWPFRQMLSQLAYKAEWHGLPVLVITPEWTSEKCSDCGGRMEKPPVAGGDVVCLNCGLVIDRDLNGARNILKRGLRSGPAGSAGEAMVGRQAPGWEPKAKVDADHLQANLNDLGKDQSVIAAPRRRREENDGAE
jgi:IS605 OrfB family transposase